MKFYYINPGGGVALFPEEGIPFRDGGHLPTPCRKEYQTMLKFIHFKNNHIKKIVMSQAFIKKGYYWSGFLKILRKLLIIVENVIVNLILKKFLLILK